MNRAASEALNEEPQIEVARTEKASQNDLPTQHTGADIPENLRSKFLKRFLIAVIVFFSIAFLLVACGLSFKMNQRLTEEEPPVSLSPTAGQHNQAHGKLSNIWISPVGVKDTSRAPAAPAERQLRDFFPYVPSFQAFKADPEYFLKKMKTGKSARGNSGLLTFRGKHRGNRRGQVTLLNPGMAPLSSVPASQKLVQAANKPFNRQQKFVQNTQKASKYPGRTDKGTRRISFGSVKGWGLTGNFRQAQKSMPKPYTVVLGKRFRH